jgi:hypothetical protein
MFIAKLDCSSPFLPANIFTWRAGKLSSGGTFARAAKLNKKYRSQQRKVCKVEEFRGLSPAGEGKYF